MLITSRSPSLQIPLVDVVSYVFSNPQHVPEDKVIMIDGPSEKTVTFGQLVDNAKKVGRGLVKKLDFKRGEVVAVYSPNQLAYSAVLWGTLAAGGIATTVNPGYTTSEFTFQLVDSRARYIVTTGALLPKVIESAKAAGIPHDNIFLFEDAHDGFRSYTWFLEGITSEESRETVTTVGEDVKSTTALLCYSSGTTGRQKGVELTHYNIVANTIQNIDSFGHSVNPETDIGIATLPFFHCYALVHILHFFTVLGMKFVVLPQFTLPEFLNLIQKYRITYLPIIPPICLALARHPSTKDYDLSSVRLITSAAAPLGKELQAEVANKLKCIAVQGYGLTETSPLSHFVQSDDVVVGSVGLLVANMEAKIIGPDGKSLGPNQDGEILLRGPNVMKGYLNNIQATRETIDANGFLHTGDIGHVDERGNFFIVDRVKELIKYKGFQVAPAELESLLYQHPLVADAAVVPRYQASQATEVPLAFVVLKAGAQASPDVARQIEEYVAAKVANHKRLRGGVRFTTEIPKSVSGKILRRILRDAVKEEDEKEAVKAKL